MEQGACEEGACKTRSTCTKNTIFSQHIHANECPNQPAFRDSTVRATKRKRLAAEASTPAASDQRASENVEKENAAPAGVLKDAVAKWMAAGPQRRKLAAEAKFKELVQTLVEIG